MSSTVERQISLGVTVCEARLPSLLLLSQIPFAKEHDGDRVRKYRENKASWASEGSSHSSILVSGKSFNGSRKFSLGLMSVVMYDSSASGGDVGSL